MAKHFYDLYYGVHASAKYVYVGVHRVRGVKAHEVYECTPNGEYALCAFNSASVSDTLLSMTDLRRCT